jgi:hypothetical protein
MADSAKLYVNAAKWELPDLYDLVVAHTEKICPKATMIKVEHNLASQTVWFFYLIKTGPGMVMITKSDVGGFPAWLIDMSARREKSLKLLQSIGEKIGGMYTAREGDGFFEELEDPFQNDADFTLKLIQKAASQFPGAANNESHNGHIDELIESLNKLRKPTDTTEG